MFPKVISVTATQKYKIHLHFADGTQGDVDLSHLAGKGIFKQWETGDIFFNVHLDPETNAVVWNESLDVCADNLYLEIRGLTFDQFRSAQLVHATN